MKFKLLFASAILSALAFTPVAYASFEAGDIAVGNQYLVNWDTGSASYYQNGKQGSIVFGCYVHSDRGDAVMSLYPTRNFLGNPSEVLVEGYNGPYTWTLHNYPLMHSGKIHVAMMRGSYAFVQCKRIY